MSTCFADIDAYFWPPMRLILSITNAYPAVITTTCHTTVTAGVLVAIPEDHNYYSGLIIRLNIPKICGMPELDKFQGEITVIDDTTFSIDIDSTKFEPFAIPVAPFPVWANTCAQVVPIGEDNDLLTQAMHNIRG